VALQLEARQAALLRAVGEPRGQAVNQRIDFVVSKLRLVFALGTEAVLVTIVQSIVEDFDDGSGQQLVRSDGGTPLKNER
jgi:hypothetical protein